MAVLSTLKDVFDYITGPWIFMSMTLRFLPRTVTQLISARDFRTLLSPSAFGDVWFGNFWGFMGPQVKEGAERRVLPLLEGRVRNGHVTDEVVGIPVQGTVLEVGAGTGMWADVFAKVDTTGQNVDKGDLKRRRGGLVKVYGIEPNLQSAAALRQRVKDVGLEGTYEVVPVGIESLNDPTAWSGRIEPGSVDCIVTILCLCSIPEPEKNIRLLYDCLKKGGRWYAYEHVKLEHGAIFMRLYQRKLATFPSTSQ